MQSRGDQKVVRWLEMFPQAVRKWQSLPLVHFSNDEHVWPTTTMHDKLFLEWTASAGESLANLLWPDVVFSYLVDSSKRHWIRVRPAATHFLGDPIDDAIIAMRKKAGSPQPYVRDKETPKNEQEWQTARDDYFHVTCFYEEWPDGDLMVSEFFMSRKDPLNKRAMKKINHTNAYAAFITYNLVSLYAYLAQCSERTVEVRQAEPKTPAGSKTAKKKPWLRDDLPYMVLLDPTKAAEVGCHRPQNASEGPHRQSPAPHDRRGHWRRLQPIPGVREAKRIFVRPAWIGPVDWQHKGRLYKVVQERKDGT